MLWEAPCLPRQGGQEYSPRWPLRPAHAPAADLIIAFAISQFCFWLGSGEAGVKWGPWGQTLHREGGREGGRDGGTPLSCVIAIQRSPCFTLVLNTSPEWKVNWWSAPYLSQFTRVGIYPVQRGKWLSARFGPKYQYPSNCFCFYTLV